MRRLHVPSALTLGVVLTALGAYALEHQELVAQRTAWPGLALGALGAVLTALAPPLVRRRAPDASDPSAPTGEP